MSPRKPPHVIEQIRSLLALEYTPRIIGERLAISKRTVQRMRICFDLFDEPYPPKELRSVLDRPCALTREHVDVSDEVSGDVPLLVPMPVVVAPGLP
jgi:hypothetical protein